MKKQQCRFAVSRSTKGRAEFQTVGCGRFDKTKAGGRRDKPFLRRRIEQGTLPEIEQSCDRNQQNDA
jgi:hypothetical protein